MHLSAHTRQEAAPVAPCCQERDICVPQGPHVCLSVLCVLASRMGRRGGEHTQRPGAAGIVLPCVSMPAGWVSGGSLVSRTAHRSWN